MQHLAGHVARIARGEEDERGRNFPGLAHPPHQHVGAVRRHFTYGLVLTGFYGVSAERTGVYLLPLAIGNFMGPLLLGRFFDTIGRRRMITATYAVAEFSRMREAG